MFNISVRLSNLCPPPFPMNNPKEQAWNYTASRTWLELPGPNKAKWFLGEVSKASSFAQLFVPRCFSQGGSVGFLDKGKPVQCYRNRITLPKNWTGSNIWLCRWYMKCVYFLSRIFLSHFLIFNSLFFFNFLTPHFLYIFPLDLFSLPSPLSSVSPRQNVNTKVLTQPFLPCHVPGDWNWGRQICPSQ